MRPAPVRALVASAARVTAEQLKAATSLADGEWQKRALAHYDSLGEIRYASQFYAKMLQPLRIFPALRTAEDKVEPITKGDPVELLDRIQDPAGGRSGILSRYGRLQFVTGEGYLFGRNISEDPDLWVQERWDFVWKDELKLDDKGNVIQRRTAQGWEEVAAGSAVAYRMWTPHPELSYKADSPMKANLNICDELLILTMSVKATATSRLARAKIFAIPSEISPAPLEPGGDENPRKDPFMTDLIEHLSSAIKDPSNAAALAPYILWASADYIDKIKDFSLHDAQSDYVERDLRKETIERLGYGLDLPPEVILGMAQANHWTGWQIKDDTWQSHGRPVAEQFCDDLGEVYLRPALEEANYPDWASVVVGYDASGVVVNPDRSKDADEAWDRGGIGYSAYRNAKRFTEEDAPTKDEHAEWLAVKLRDTAALPAASQNGSQPGPPPGEPGPVSEQTNLPNEGSLRVLGAAELAIIRCRELAGSRLRSHRLSCPECLERVSEVPNAQLVASLGPEDLLSLGSPDPMELVSGGGDLLRTLLISWGQTEKEAQAVAGMLEVHAARTLFESGLPKIPVGLLSRLEEAA